MELTGQPVLAFGTAGAQGSGIIGALTAVGAVPVRVTSRPKRAEQWRAAGEQAVVADLTDTDSVLSAAQSSGAVAVAGHGPLSLGHAVPAAMSSFIALRGLGLPVTVNTGSPTPPEGAPDPFGGRATAQALLDAGVTVLTPTGYLENHAAPWALARIAAGELIYPRPATDVVAWIAAGDLGRAAVAALGHDIEGELLALAGPELLSFDGLAVELGDGLGRELNFVRVAPAEYGAALAPFLGVQGAASVEAAYASMPEQPNPGFNPPEAGANWERLGIAPVTARQWAGTVLAGALGAFMAAR